MEKIMNRITNSTCTARNVMMTALLCLLCSVAHAGDTGASGLYAPEVPPRAQYYINCKIEFDSAKALVSGTETISLTNTSSLPLERLAMEGSGESLDTMEMAMSWGLLPPVSSPMGV